MTEHFYALPLRRGLAFWQQLTEPSPSVKDEDERRQSRLLASLLLSVMFAVLLLAPVPLLVNHFPPQDDPQFIATLVAAAVMFIAYQANRRGHYRAANILTIVYGTVAIFVASILVGGTSGINGLYYLLTLVIFASLFMSLRVTAVLIAIHTIGILILAVVNSSVHFPDLLIGPLSFDLFMGCIIMLVAYHWRRSQTSRQEKLIESEARYRMVSELMSDYAFSCRVEPDGRFTLEWITDPAFTGLAEHTPHDAREGGLLAFQSGDQDEMRQEWKRILQGESVDSEHRITTSTGKTSWIHLHRRPIWDEQQKRVVRFYGVVKIITERKEAEIALRESEERYRVITELLSDFAFSYYINPDGTLKLNWITEEPFTRLTGYTAADLHSGGLFVFHPNDAPAVDATREQTRLGEVTEGEYRIVTKDGGVFWAYVRRHPIWSPEENRYTVYYGIAKDITQQKEAEIALRESEERYRMISETISDYAFSFSVAPDKSISMEWVTDSIMQVAGYTPAELATLSAQQPFALYHADDVLRVKADLDKLVEGGSAEGEYRIIAKNGEMRWVYIYRRPIWDEHEQRVVRFYGIADDITERKQAEVALRESEERYRAISELISDYAFSCVVTPDGQLPLDWITDSVVYMTGYSADEVRTIPGFSCIHPDDVNRAHADIAKVLNNIVTDSEYRFITKGGEERWMRMYRRPVWSESEKRVIRLYAVVEDITERKQAEETLRHSEERYRIISEMISDYAFSVLVEADGRLKNEWITESVRNVTGFEPEEFIQRTMFSLYHPDDHAIARADVEKVLHGTATINEYRSVTKAGEMRWLRMYRRPIWDENQNRVVRYYAVAQDVTEHKQIETQKLRLALEQERLTMVSQFVQAFSHDVRTSLATIETSRYLIERLITDSGRNVLQIQLNKIHHSVTHLAEQLNNLHMISSLSDPTPIPCQLNRVVESLVAEHSLRARQKQQTLVFEPDNDLAVIPADEAKLRQAIQHLLLNALANTHEGGQITLRTRQNETYIRIEVQDTGAGIEPEKLADIFEPFYKTDTARTLEAGGMGLGLSIVSMIVEAHGGQISVESQPGQGSIFTILLPAKREIAAPETHQPA